MSRTLENSSKKAKTSKHDFTLFWAKLTAGYPRVVTTPATMVRYYELLNRFTPGQLASAVDIAADECEVFPTPAKLIQIIKRKSLELPRPKLLDEPRPSPEQIDKNRALLREIIDGHKMKGQP